MYPSEKTSGEAALWGRGELGSSTSFKEGPVLFRFTGKPVGHQLCFSHGLLISSLMRLSPCMFLLYLYWSNLMA